MQYHLIKHCQCFGDFATNMSDMRDTRVKCYYMTTLLDRAVVLDNVVVVGPTSHRCRTVVLLIVFIPRPHPSRGGPWACDIAGLCLKR